MLQVDRINENTIRVRMDAAELKKRGMTMLDLLGDKSEIQQFFYSILDEVDKEHTFAQTDAVTFQVMPSTDGLELLISKVNAHHPSTLAQILQEAQQKTPTEQSKQTAIVTDLRRVFRLNDFEQVIALADSLKADDLASSLYVYRNQYYLDLGFINEQQLELKPEDAWAIANEFGKGMTHGQFQTIRPLTKCLLRQDALATLRYYFN